jgi:Na+/melibiose symporter-like transporter
VFWVNLPIGLLGFIVLAWQYHERREKQEMDLDLPGVGSLAVASMALLSLVSRLGPEGWSAASIIMLIAVTVGAAAFFAWHERRAANPILPTDLFRQRAIGPAIIGSCLFGAGFLSLDTFVPLYIQGGRGGDATAAASVVTPVMLTWALSGTLAAQLLVRWGFRKTARLGTSIIIVGFSALLICAWTEAPRSILTATLAVTGLGFGPTGMSFLLCAQDAVTYRQRGIITSSISFFRVMGGALGIGILGAVFNMLTSSGTARLRTLGVKPADLLDPRARASIPADTLASAQHMIAGGLTWVFAAMVAIAAILWCVTLALPAARCAHKVSATEAMDAV